MANKLARWFRSGNSGSSSGGGQQSFNGTPASQIAQERAGSPRSPRKPEFNGSWGVDNTLGGVAVNIKRRK